MSSISGHLERAGRPSSLISALILLFLLMVKGTYAAEFGRLPSGAEYIIERRGGPGVVAIQVWVKVGSRAEDEGLAGITHFIEHLIFKGTESLGANELASKIESMGGAVNAFTSYDNTVYHVVIPKEAFEEGFKILAESVLNPAFPEEEVEKERKVILEEIKMGEDDPQRRLYKELFLLSYEGHPYGRPIIGFEETLIRTKREHIVEYFRRHYRPSNMVFVIVGDVDEENAKALIASSFHDKLDGPGDQGSCPLPKRRGREKVIHMDIKESYMAISYPIPPILHEDLPFLEIASSILGEGESSRLKEELRNRKGLVTDIWSSLFAQKEGGLFVVYATFHGTDYKAVRQAIEAVIRKTAEGRIERWELRKAKNRLNASLAYEAETVQGRARQIGYFYSLTGRRDFLEWYVKRAHTATERDVKTVLERYLRRGGGDLVVLLPPTQNARAFGLENGLKIVMNKNGAGSFSFAMGFPGGLKEEDQGENGVFNLLSRMFLRGTKRSSSRQIAKAIDVLAGEITPFCGRNVFGLSGRFLAKDMEQAFKLLRQLIAESAFRQEELERVRREVLSELRQKKDDPLSFTFRCFEEAFYDGHPYARDPSGSESHVANIGLADLERYYREFVGPRGAVLAVSGDIDLERTERLLRRIFSSWNGNGALLRRTPYEPKEIPRTVKIARDLKQNHIVVGFKGVSLVQKERYAAEVLEAILSRMGGRFYKALREERPYAYALAFFNRMGFDTGEMGIYAATDKRLTEEVLRSIEEELDRLQHGLEEGEVEEAKRFLVGNHLIRMQSNETIAFRMCLDTLYGLSPDSFKDWPYHIKAVRKEEVESLIRTHLRPSGAITVIVGEP